MQRMPSPPLPRVPQGWCPGDKNIVIVASIHTHLILMQMQAPLAHLNDVLDFRDVVPQHILYPRLKSDCR